MLTGKGRIDFLCIAFICYSMKQVSWKNINLISSNPLQIPFNCQPFNLRRKSLSVLYLSSLSFPKTMWKKSTTPSALLQGPSNFQMQVVIWQHNTANFALERKDLSILTFRILHKLHLMELKAGYSNTLIYALQKCNNTLVTHSGIQKIHATVSGDRSTNPRSVIVYFRINWKPLPMSKHHVSTQKFLLEKSLPPRKVKPDSAQRLPPPPQATPCPGAVPNLLPSACRATAAAGSAPWRCSATVGPRRTEPRHLLSRVSPLLPTQEAQRKGDRVKPLGTPSTDLVSTQIRFSKYCNLY